MNRNDKWRALLVSSSVAISAMSSVAAAQDQASDAGEIIVTAQKREQSINDVGLTIQALGGSELKDRQVNSLSDLAQVVPGLSYSTSANNTPVFTLRGVGFYDTSLASYPTVSVYLDEVPLPLPVQTTLTAFDLQRVEVLKGPQGTLFGNNATGGAINYVAAKPTSSFDAGADVTYGRFNTFVGEGFVSGPLSDTLSARFAVKGTHGGDWQRSYTRDDSHGRSRQIAGRFLLNWEPASNLKFALNLNGWKDTSDLIAFQYYALNLQVPAAASPDLVAYPFSPLTPRAADWSVRGCLTQLAQCDARPRADNRLLQASLRADWEFGAGITLTSITSYIDYKHDQVPEGDGVAINAFDLSASFGHANSFSQELRLSNDGAGGLRWVVGANYGHDDVAEVNYLDDPEASGARNLPHVGSIYSNDQVMKNYAAFANVEYEIIPTVTLKGGARYTEAKRRSRSCNTDLPGFTNLSGIFTFLQTVFAPDRPAVPVPVGGCITLDENFFPGPFNGKLNENNVSWRAGADFKPADHVLLYANISKGYKAGSFGALSASTSVQNAPVTQESVLAYEAGFKAQLVDRVLSLNGALYYYDYKNKQLRSKIIDPVWGILDALVNVPKSRVKGAEIELALTPLSGLNIGVAATYSDAKVTNYVGVNAGGQATDFAGTRVPYTPKYQVGVNLDHRLPVIGSLVPFYGASLTHRSKANSIVGGISTYNVDAYTLLDLRGGVETEDGRWKFSVWGKNITNKYYWSNTVASYDVIVRIPGRPATYGATLSYRLR
jgi:iron complex outermembrane receptor protein